jgi:hypothetical protein
MSASLSRTEIPDHDDLSGGGEYVSTTLINRECVIAKLLSKRHRAFANGI